MSSMQIRNIGKLCIDRDSISMYDYHSSVLEMLDELGWLITLIKDNITLTTTDIPSTINTHNTELQMVKATH